MDDIMTMEFFNDPIEEARKMTAMGRKALRDINMHAIKTFLDTGNEHGTTVEALYEAFQAVFAGEAQTISEALQIGAREWYK